MTAQSSLLLNHHGYCPNEECRSECGMRYATMAVLKQDIRSLSGNTALVDLGPQASREVLAACGLSPTLFDAKAAAAAREA